MLQRSIFSQAGPTLHSVVQGQIYRGLAGGLRGAFVIDKTTRDRLAIYDPSCARLLRRTLSAPELQPWRQALQNSFVIWLPRGWTRQTFGKLSESEAWALFGVRHPALARHLEPFAAVARQRQRQGDYWWEMPRSQAQTAFDQPKIAWPSRARRPRLSIVPAGMVPNDSIRFIASNDHYLLGILGSRIGWWFAAPSNYGNVPIPNADQVSRQYIADLTEQLVKSAQTRTELGHTVQRRILADYGPPGSQLSPKLARWWRLNAEQVRAEINRALKNDIPYRYREEWSLWFQSQCDAYAGLSATLVRNEAELNQEVSRLFGLTIQQQTELEELTNYQNDE